MHVVTIPSMNWNQQSGSCENRPEVQKIAPGTRGETLYKQTCEVVAQSLFNS